MTYFKNCKTIDEAKAEFRKLCMSLHPDTSGKDTEAGFWWCRPGGFPGKLIKHKDMSDKTNEINAQKQEVIEFLYKVFPKGVVLIGISNNGEEIQTHIRGNGLRLSAAVATSIGGDSSMKDIIAGAQMLATE